MRIKFKAFSIHFTISLCIFLAFLSTIIFVWYPSFYFHASGAWDALFTVAIVDVVLGPLLTLVLYKPGKPGLKFDLSMIVLFQISALIWGIWVLYSERPILTVYYQDAFYCLSQTATQRANANVAAFENAGGVVPQAFLPLPKTPEEDEARRVVLSQLPDDSSSPNIPPYVFGDKFEAITKYKLSKMMAYELDIVSAVKVPKYQEIYEAFLDKHKDAAQTYAFLPLRCSATEHMAAVDRNTGIIVDSMAISSLNAIRKNY
jgi:hypothetical protein